MRKFTGIAAGLLMLIGSIAACKKDKSIPYDAEKQLAADTTLIKNYIADSIPAIKDEYGVYYVIKNPGSDVKPTDKSVVTVKYTGRLLNGQVFDKSDNLVYPLNQFIDGWRIGIPKIGKGGKIRLIIPSVYGYGPTTSGPIPPNSVLDFDVELLEVKN